MTTRHELRINELNDNSIVVVWLGRAYEVATLRGWDLGSRLDPATCRVALIEEEGRAPTFAVEPDGTCRAWLELWDGTRWTAAYAAEMVARRTESATSTTLETEARDCADAAWRDGTDSDRRTSAGWELTAHDLDSIESALGAALDYGEIQDAQRAFAARLGELRAALPPRRTGPPSRAPEGTAAEVVSVRLTTRERDAFEAAAGEAGVGPWLRGLGRVAAGLDAPMESDSDKGARWADEYQRERNETLRGGK